MQIRKKKHYISHQKVLFLIVVEIAGTALRITKVSEQQLKIHARSSVGAAEIPDISEQAVYFLKGLRCRECGMI